MFSIEFWWWFYVIAFATLSHRGWLKPPVISALTALAVLDCFEKWDKQFKKAEVNGSALTEPKDRREFVAPEAVLKFYSRNGFGVLKSINKFFGKWTQVSGTVEGAAESLTHDGVHLSLKLGDGQRINLRFPSGRTHEIMGLSAGQLVAAVTQVQPVPSFGGGYFAFENSELVKVLRTP